MKKRKKRTIKRKRRDPTMVAVGKLARETSGLLDEVEIILDQIREVAGQANSSVASLKAALEGAPRRFLKNEIEIALQELRGAFRDGPVQINESLIRLAQDILQEQIREVLRDQMQKLVSELTLIVREEVQTEVYAACREALAAPTE